MGRRYVGPADATPRREKLLLGTLAVGMLIAAALLADPNADAHPDGHDAGPAVETSYTELLTVDGVDYPVCRVEDCSDQPGQVGVWTSPDDGRRWLSLGEGSSVPITP